MNVDPARLELREYAALLHGWNADEADKPRAPVSDRLRKAMEAATVH